MKNILIIFLLLNSLIGFSQKNDLISIGIRDSLYSKILNEPRELWIYKPRGFERESKKKDIYPVLYLLDGDYNFHATTGIVEFLSKNQICPEMIVVGIINTDRNRDFLPTHDPSMKGSGGASQFTDFLRKELIPYIDSKYPTAPYKMIVGHSLGGVLAINTLIHSQEIFNSYIAIDPSLWWDNNIMLRQFNEVALRTNLTNKVLYMTSANLKRGVDSLGILKDTTKITNGVRVNFEFYGILDSTKTKTGIESKFQYYPNETHSTLPMISIYDGFQYIFDFYKRPSFANVGDTTFHAKEILLEHYKKVSLHLGYKVLPPDDLINGIAFLYRINNMEEKANEILELMKLKDNE